MAPTLNTLVPGDRQLIASWTNDPSFGINNAFLFLLNKATNMMTKINLTNSQALSQSYTIGDPSMNLVNGIEYMVQYVQQQTTATGVTFGSNTQLGVPSGKPLQPGLSLVQVLDGGVIVSVAYRGNNGTPYTSVEFRIADTSNNIMSSQEVEFPADADVPGSVSDASYQITGLTNNTPYDIACYVYNANGSCEQISNTISINPTDQPNPPDALTALSGEDIQVTVSFKNSVQPGGVTIDYWEVYKALAASTSFSLLATLPYVDGSANYVVLDTAVVNGTGYQYKVVGVSTDAVIGVVSSSVTALPFKPVEIGTFTVVSGDQTAACAWTLNSAGATYISPPNVVYYDLAYSIGATDFSYNDVEYDDLSFNTLSKLITGLTNGEVYNFRVRAKSIIPTAMQTLVDAPSQTVADLPFAIGEWVYQNGVTPATTPNQPTNLAAIVDSHIAQLTWLAPSNDGGAVIGAYNVYQYASASDASLNLNAVLVATVVPPVENYTVMDLLNGTSYWFRITAINRLGEGPLSAPLGPVIPFDNVDPAIFLDAVQLDASSTFVDISLNWTSPVPVAGIVIVQFDVYTVAVNGTMTFLATKLWNEFDSSNADTTRNYSVNDFIAPPPIDLGVTYAIQTVALNPNYPTDPQQYIYSTYAFEYILVAKPPTLSGTPTASWDAVAGVSYYRFTVDTHDEPLLGAVLYAPPASDMPPIPNPITVGTIGSAVDGIYTFTVDYQVITATSTVGLSYFVMFSNRGGSTTAQLGI